MTGGTLHVTLKYGVLKVLDKSYPLCDELKQVHLVCPLKSGNGTIALDEAIPKLPIHVSHINWLYSMLFHVCMGCWRLHDTTVHMYKHLTDTNVLCMHEVMQFYIIYILCHLNTTTVLSCCMRKTFGNVTFITHNVMSWYIHTTPRVL